jgi:hypothetical protein
MICTDLDKKSEIYTETIRVSPGITIQAAVFVNGK